ncbi:MAG: iron ABC transporter permease [Spirochaetales bacterium]|uniref:Iron ABC transporter permease n=1 Tax=Candidatus Thalassospirochaeta sargassi TaxID=3119039 RepID=A0AAJ1IFK4_9SPIO|nr:iron ABC transporter permease [Spirochaetales bacterium]
MTDTVKKTSALSTLNGKSRSNKWEFALVIAISLISLFVLFTTSLAVGRYSIPFDYTLKILFSKIFFIEKVWGDIQEAVVFNLRLPRSTAAVLIGAALSLSGATYQSIFKNPLVSPDLLGVSGGACVGAAIAILMSAGSTIIQLGAFAGGLIAVGITVSIPTLIRNTSTIILVLSGIVISSLMSSIISIIKFVADTDTQLAEITYWLMGSFASISFIQMLPVLPTIIIPVVIILLMRYRLNVLSLGDMEAKSLGINLGYTRGIFILCSTLITAGCVSLSGTIGWVGLVIPHTARMIIGADNKRMLPVTMIFGGIFMLAIDILSRTITSAELRLGILTGIIGAPFFLFILFKQKEQLK